MCQGKYLFGPSADTAKSRYPSFHTGYQHFGPWSKYLDGPSRFSWNKAIMRWVFQSLPRPVGFTLDLLYESGSQTPLKGCMVRVAVGSIPCVESVRWRSPGGAARQAAGTGDARGTRTRPSAGASPALGDAGCRPPASVQ